MSISEAAKQYLARMFPGRPAPFAATDPEFTERFENFAFDEVPGQDDLGDRTRILAILATLLGCQGVDLFREMVPAALNAGLSPVEIKETVYQAVAYLGMGRAYPFLKAVNEVLEAQGVSLPLEGQATTTMDTRLSAGNQAQVDIFGEGMRGFQDSGPEESRHINKWLADNCFGDYYTRKGLDYAQRELITFCAICCLGGCEPKAKSHAGANISVGNTRELLIDAVTQCLPFIGFPRTLNAISCINEVTQ